jgi:hypothetical protein
VTQIYTLWQTTQPWRRRFGQLFQIVALIFMGYALWQSVQLLWAQEAQVDYGLLAAACGLTLGVVLLGGLDWGCLAIAFRFEGAWWWHVRAHLLANVAKYLPGSLWSHLSKGGMAVQAGASKRQAVGAAVMEMALALASGGMMVGYTGWLVVAGGPPWIVWVGFATLLPFVVYFLYLWLAGWSGFKPGQPELLALLAGLLIFTIGWLLLAVSMAWLAAAIGAKAQLYVHLFVLCLAMICGLLVIPAPNGAGVRESVLVLLLSWFIPVPAALFVALALRIAIMVGELSAFVVVLTAFSKANQANTPIGLLPKQDIHGKNRVI